MTYINSLCADAGTANCPCPLAETGDCLVCSRLAGREECDCRWAGVCVYNEYIQNGGMVRESRRNKPVAILKKIWYGRDLLVIVLKVSKGFALKAAQPGSFVFVNTTDKGEFFNVPVSIMRTEPDEGRLFLALKVVSAKTKAIAEAEKTLMIRGVYRNGFLGGGLAGLKADMRQTGQNVDKKRWLIITKGIGFAPAVNLMKSAADCVKVDFITDAEKISDEMVMDSLQKSVGNAGTEVSFHKESLRDITEALKAEKTKGRPVLLSDRYNADMYDRIILLTSDYYIKTLAEYMDIPSHKLVFCNNFRMCCGEGICGACCHVDENGNASKMCKCRNIDVTELL